jgi:peptidylprolyl isomerase
MAQTGDPANTGQGASVLPNIPAEFTFKMDGPKPGSDSDFTPVLHPPGHDVGFIGSLPVISQPAAVAALMADGKLAANPTFCQGVFGIARGDDPNSANSQFFMMRQPHSALDAKYTAIGRVIVGEDVVRQIKTGEPVPQPQDRMQRVAVLADMPEGVRPTVRVADVKSPYFAALLAQTKRDVGDGISICDIELPAQAK